MRALVTDGLVEHASCSPGKAALQVGAVGRTYGELLSAVRRVAAGVASIPAAGGSPRPPGRARPGVGLLLGNRAEFLEVFLGTAMAGALAVVLDPKWTDAQLAAVLDEQPPDLLVAEASRLSPMAAARGIPVVPVGGSGAGPAYPAWLAGRPPDQAPPSGVRPDTLFYAGFTSGTTGRPKAFVRSHRSWLASFAASAVEFGTGPADHVLAPGPLVHGLTLYAAVEGIAAGATVHLLETFDADAVLARLDRHPVTVLVVVPTMLATILEAAFRRGLRAEGVRAIVSSGSKLQPAVAARVQEVFPAAETIEYYGASELSFVTVLSSREGGPTGSVGRPFHAVAVEVRLDDGRRAAAGEVGRIFVRSDLISSGYLGPGDGSGFRLEAGWATVGDYGWLDAGGYLHLAGREGDMMITGGLNVYPAEVEAVLREVTEVDEAAVLALPDPHWGDLVCAVVRWREGARLARAELEARCRRALARYKCPRRFLEAERLPYTTSGKVARAVLREWIVREEPSVREIP